MSYHEVASFGVLLSTRGAFPLVNKKIGNFTKRLAKTTEYINGLVPSNLQSESVRHVFLRETADARLSPPT